MGMICETDEEFLYIDNEVEDKLYDIVINHDDSFYRDIMSSPSNYDRDQNTHHSNYYICHPCEHMIRG